MLCIFRVPIHFSLNISKISVMFFIAFFDRAAIEEAYSRSMTKLAKSVSNYTQLGLFAPVWDVFKISTEKLSSCHLDLMRRLQELIKEVHKYGDEQIKTYKKTKEDVSRTLEAVQNIQSITQALQKSKENYNAKFVEQERLKKEGATQKEVDKAAVKLKKATDTYKLYVEKYAAVKSAFEQEMKETAQVHEEFIDNMKNTTVRSLIQKFSESKGTGKERPDPVEFQECNTASAVEGIKPEKRKPFGLSGIMKKEKDTESMVCPDTDSVNIPDVDDEGYSIKPEASQDTEKNHFYSSSDSDTEEDEPRRFHVEIKPIQSNNSSQYTMPSLDELKASIGNIALSPAISKHSSAQPNQNASSKELTKSKLSAPANERGNSDLLSWDPLFSSSPESSSSTSLVSSSSSAKPTNPLSVGTIVPPPRPASTPKVSTGKLSGINETPRPFSPPLTSNSSPPPAAPLAHAESISSISSASLSAANTPTVGVSCGPSPVRLGNQDIVPVAVALTESVNAYFKGADPTKCIVKITGDMTLSFPSGILKVFTSNPSPAVLCFRVKNTSKLEHILPNAQLVYSDQSQSDSSSKDFWMNMQAITVYLKKLSEHNPSASYYNVDVLKYQVSSNGIQSTPLNLATYWKCNASTTDVRMDYKYNPESMNVPSMLSNVQVVVQVDGGVKNMQSLPPAKWNADQMKAYWKISSISEKSENGGSGSLRAKFELSEGPSKLATLAVQFISEGSTLSGIDVELIRTGYRLSLLKKRFASG
ncbi:F-BAR domain only protein 2-like [Serinus canaria]|uniref:F-BAR domain only protein 2-like n=1 Tax=Serinus canaria TaxID=9135 RepID=UPI0021CC5AE1|nr:F-BAR domain only protein 2-like [Serinus canaria]